MKKAIGKVLTLVPIQFAVSHVAVNAGYEHGGFGWWCYVVGLGFLFLLGWGLGCDD